MESAGSYVCQDAERLNHPHLTQAAGRGVTRFPRRWTFVHRRRDVCLHTTSCIRPRTTYVATISARMRPNNTQTCFEVYECFYCGVRAEGINPGTCEECGGELLHLGRSRDL
ncbi:rubrerythrin-like domain-containing protein [Natronomonas sp.]|uniref:rubrerythrin-like domain-containing protein n=1 Tax=Natronomonas sp. TaxID=2184060 RepID=UPI003975D8CE